MELKPGYKLTEVGVIPEEWKVTSLGLLGTFSKGQGVRKSEADSGDLPCVRYGEIYTHHNDIIRAYNSRISRCVASTSRRLMKGDILFAGSGETKEEIGKAVAYVGDDEAYAGGDIVILSPRSASSEFLGYLLNAPFAVRQKAGKGQGDAVVHISATALGAVVIPVPPLREQRAIAAALSDMDALLHALDRLIAKKHNLKKAVMQQLLTGQTRLPGFHGEWEVKKLGDIGEIAGSGVDKKLRPNESRVRLLNYMDVYHKDFIYSKDLDHWVTAPPDKVRRCAVVKGDVFFTPSSETKEDIANSAVAMEDIDGATYSYHLVRLRLRDAWDIRFRAYAFKTREFLKQAERVCDGGGTRYVISLAKFRSLTVHVPPVAEQAAIATIHSDMDTEISVLEARRDKTRALKQGMMQELLTGSTRLIDSLAEGSQAC